MDDPVRAIVDATPIALVALDADGRISLASPPARALFAPMDPIGRTLADLPPDLEIAEGGTTPAGRLVALVDRRAERRRERLMRATGAAAWELEVAHSGDLRDGKFTWTEGVQRLLGLPPDAAAIFGAIEAADRTRISAVVAQAIATGEPYAIDFRIRRGDGSIRTVHSETEVSRGADGRVNRITGTMQDVTDRQDHVAWEALIDSAPDVIVRLALDGTVLSVNRANAAELIGQPWSSLAPVEYRDRMIATLVQVVATGERAVIELPQPMDDGLHWYQCHLGPIRRSGVVEGVILIARDITPRRQAEQQLAVSDRLASVGTMAAGVAHEINNPLASVIANLDVALRQASGALEEPLRDAAQAAERVREIVRDLKLFSRAGDERRGPVDVRRVLETTVRMAGNEIRHRAMLELELEAVPMVEANEARLAQVFLNLLLNAAQAIQEGDADHQRIRVATRAADGKVIISVSDTGSGIPVEQQSRIFTPFFTTKPVGLGTGLGLSICHRIVTSLGGEIDFRSTTAGTEFRVALPAAVVREPEPAPRKRTTGPPVRRARVLVVDDEPLITRAVRRILGTQHDVTAVDNGAQALDAIRGAAQPFDVILCDLMMPVMSGMDLHAALVRDAPLDAARVVFMTGGAFTPRAREFLEAIDNPRVDKPFDAASLRALINGLVR